MTSESCAPRDLAASGSGLWIWGLPLALIAAGLIWSGPRAPLWALAFTWAGAACVFNAARCGRVHCHVTGPLYLALGLVSALIGLGVLDWSWRLVGIGFVAGTAVAFFPEFAGRRYARKAH